MPENTSNPEQEVNRILSVQNQPYKTEQIARSAMEKKGLDSSQWKVSSYEDGYAIVPKPKTAEEKYYTVMFNPRSDPGETEDVHLIVNGDVLVCQRGVKVIIPERYKECADHTTIPIFNQKPNEARKEVGNKMLYPYSSYGEATKAEYLKFLSEGNRKTKQDLAAAKKLI